MFDQNAFNKFIIENKVIRFFDNPVTFKSGRLSHSYINWRTPTTDMFLLDQLTDFVLAFTKQNNIEVDCFYGVPEGATKVGVLCQFKLAKTSTDFQIGSHVAAMGRSKEKQHGDPKDKFFVGAPTGKVVIVEDTITTGGSLLNTIEKLKEANINIVAAIALTDRGEKTELGTSVKEEVEKKGVQYFTMSNGLELTKIALQDQSDAMKQHLINYYKKYGVHELIL